MHENAAQNDDNAQWITDTDDAIRVTRPDWMTDQQWVRLKAETDVQIARIIKTVTGRCTRHSWCVMNARSSEHDEYCCGEGVSVLGAGRTEDTSHRWWCWLTQDAGSPEPEMVFEGRLNDGGPMFSFEVRRRDLVALQQILCDPTQRKTVATMLRGTDERPAAGV